VREIGIATFDILLGTCLKIGIALLILAIFDYGYQRWKHEQDLRMTTQEVREEYKMLQGDPHMAARRRQVQRQLVINRLHSSVPKADVVVTNPTELAVAIQYEPDTMEAPIVVAKGPACWPSGSGASRWSTTSRSSNANRWPRRSTSTWTSTTDPPEQYAAVAEILRMSTSSREDPARPECRVGNDAARFRS